MLDINSDQLETHIAGLAFSLTNLGLKSDAEIEQLLRSCGAIDRSCAATLSTELGNYAETDELYDDFREEASAWEEEFAAEPLVDAYYAKTWLQRLENAGLESNMSGRLRISAAVKKLEDFDLAADNADDVIKALQSEIILHAVESDVLTTTEAVIQGAKSADELPPRHESL